MLWLTILCVVLWLLLGESTRALLLAGERLYRPGKEAVCHKIPRIVYWIVAPFLMLWMLVGAVNGRS